MLQAVVHASRTYLDPFYQNPALAGKKNLSYGLCSLTNLTTKAAKIENKIIRYVAQFFALFLDATLGCGLVGTLLYNSGAFFYNHSCLREKEPKSWQWNTTALKTWGVLLGLVVGGKLLSHFGKDLWRQEAHSVTYPQASNSSPLKQKIVELSKCKTNCQKLLVDLRQFSPFNEIPEARFLKIPPAPLFPPQEKWGEEVFWGRVKKLESCKDKESCWNILRPLLSQPKFQP